MYGYYFINSVVIFFFLQIIPLFFNFGSHFQLMKKCYWFITGILLDLFKCDSVYFSAVEVTAGNRLFYHVVNDDRIAMKILKEVCCYQVVLISETN